jgi:hypothetical protein
MNDQLLWSDGDIPIPPSGMDVTHRLSPLNRRLRMEFLAGAERESRRRLGRPSTAEELERALGRYPGDIRVTSASLPRKVGNSGAG